MPGKPYYGKTLDEWRELPRTQWPVRVRMAIHNSDAYAAGLAGSVDPEAEAEEEVGSEADPVLKGPAYKRPPVSKRPTMDEFKSEIRSEGEEWLNQLGAVNDQGQYVFTPVVLNDLTLDTIFALRYHVRRGDLKAVDIAIHKLMPEPKQEMDVRVMTAEQIEAQKERLLSEFTPEERAVLQKRVLKSLP